MWVLLISSLCAFTAGAVNSHKLNKRAPIDGGWSSWETTPYCSKTCGGGLILEKRECNNPVPSSGGQKCVGPDTRTTATKCNERHCPFEGFATALTMMNRQDLLPSYRSALQTFIQLNTNSSGLSTTPPSPSYGTCTMAGDPHVWTFDKTHYSFYGACVYYAVYDDLHSLKYPRFNIQIETVKCNKDRSCVQRAIINVFPCPTSTQASLSNNSTLTPTVIEIDALYGGVSINGRDVTGNLPELVEDAHLIIQRDGFVTKTTCYCNYNHGSFAIYWNGQHNIEVQVGSSVKNQILGLCGKWNGNPRDDFTLIDRTTLPWKNNSENTLTVQKFTKSYQLPSHENTCSGPLAPPQCTTPYHDTSLYCNVFRRGSMYKCNENPSSIFYADPTEIMQECFSHVCLEPDDASKAKRACLYYVQYAMKCYCKGVTVDLSGYQGCEPPTVSITPHNPTVREGCPATFQCTVTGWPIPPIQWTHNGKDIDLGSRKEITCNANRTVCTLKIFHTNATVDSGTYTCSVDNYIGKASASSDLTVRVVSFTVDTPSEFLVGSTVSVDVSKTPASSLAANVQLDLIDSNSRFVTTLVKNALFGSVSIPLKTLPAGAAFGLKYRIRASWNQSECTPIFGYSNYFEFVRGVIHASIPTDKSGNPTKPPIVYFGTEASLVWNYDQSLTFLSYLMIDLYHKNGSFYTNLFPKVSAKDKQLDWWVGVSRYLNPGDYYIFLHDSQTGTRGKSNVFTLNHADMCIVTSSEITFGTDVSVFVKVEPEDVKQTPLQYYLTDERCQNDFHNLTNDISISGHSHYSWKLPRVIQGTNGLTFRLRAKSGKPSYLSSCSDNTIQFRNGTISVNIEAKSSTVYITEPYKITFDTEEDLPYLKFVSVYLLCTSGRWKIASNVSMTIGEVTWNVSQESATPIQPGDVCRAFVADTGYTGASGFSQNVTVAKICVVADSVFYVGQPADIGVSGLEANSKDLLVQIVKPDEPYGVVYTIDNRDLHYEDNIITWRHAVLSSKANSVHYYRVRVENNVTGAFGLSQKIQFSIPTKSTKSPPSSKKINVGPNPFIASDSHEQQSKSGRSNAGVIAGAVIGSIVGILLVIGLVFKIRNRKRGQRLLDGKTSHATDGGTMSWRNTTD